MKEKKLNNFEELKNIKFNNLSPDPEPKLFKEKKDTFNKQNLEAHFSNKGRAGKIVTIIKGFIGPNNDIKVIIFVLPQQRYFLDLVPEYDKEIFYASLEEIKNEFNVEIYDLSDDYADLNIWMDHNHVAYNKKSMIFSDDIYKIISKEMG